MYQLRKLESVSFASLSRGVGNSDECERLQNYKYESCNRKGFLDLSSTIISTVGLRYPLTHRICVGSSPTHSKIIVTSISLSISLAIRLQRLHIHGYQAILESRTYPSIRSQTYTVAQRTECRQLLPRTDHFSHRFLSCLQSSVL